MLKVETIVLLGESFCPLQICTLGKEEALWEGLLKDGYKSGYVNREVKWFKIRDTTLILYI